MSLTKQILQQGNGADYPRPDDDVVIEYTGWLFDANRPNNNYRGRKFDSSVSKGQPFAYRLGLGAVIQGWEQALPQMSLGEKSLWTFPANLAYGATGFPGLIPPNVPLVFEIELRGINNKRARTER